MNVVLLGAPGAGKGTQAVRLAERFEVPHISTGDMFRQAVAEGTDLGLEAKGYMDAGELVPDSVVIGIVKQRLEQPDASAGFILDGFPRTVPQADALDDALQSMGKRIEHVVDVEVPRESLVKRMTARRTCRQCGRIYNILTDRPTHFDKCDDCGGEVYVRADDTVETVTNRLEVYDRNTAPLIDYYRGKGLLRTVNGDQSPDKVFDDVVSILK